MNLNSEDKIFIRREEYKSLIKIHKINNEKYYVKWVNQLCSCVNFKIKAWKWWENKKQRNTNKN